MLPWKSIIDIKKPSERPIYLQLTDAVITEIKDGILKPGTKMPGSRLMAEELDLNRQTVVKAYDELYSQGWLELISSKGTFVSDQLPEIKPLTLNDGKASEPVHRRQGFCFSINKNIHEPAATNRHVMGFHDGPDVRLVPSALIARGYTSVLRRKSGLLLLSYVDPAGSHYVRQAISEYLNASRGLQTTQNNIMLTRGTQMGMFILAHVLFKKDDLMITADIGYRYAELTFSHAGVKFVRVPVDDDGIDVDAVEQACRKKRIRAIYVTSHHHYPTTVTLCAERRKKLLKLSEEYGFIIIEDDYDYEFHYESSPILPLASADRHGMVIYIGSFSKTITPGLRLGYVVASPQLVTELTKLRMLIDVQGDAVMEQVVAELLNEGEINRHMKKSLKTYKERRDFMCSMMREKLGDVVEFSVPQGGLSIWAQFDKRVKVPDLAERLLKKEIILSKGLLHDLSARRTLNSTRMGFGWMNLKEAEKAVTALNDTVKNRS